MKRRLFCLYFNFAEGMERSGNRERKCDMENGNDSPQCADSTGREREMKDSKCLWIWDGY